VIDAEAHLIALSAAIRKCAPNASGHERLQVVGASYEVVVVDFAVRE
jgi:hypothetical protein